MPSEPDALALFAKAAIPGRVKTRLTRRYSPEQAAAFHAACVRDVWARLTERFPGRVWLFSDRDWPEWRELAGGDRFRLQKGADLGERMRLCFEDLRADGAGRMAIIGSDSPTLPLGLAEKSLAALRTEQDASLIPTEDGGYCLIGCRRPDPAMFEGVSWSTEATLAQTHAALERAGYGVTLVGLWRDVDEPEDVERLRDEPELGQNLRQFFEELEE